MTEEGGALLEHWESLVQINRLRSEVFYLYFPGVSGNPRVSPISSVNQNLGF